MYKRKDSYWKKAKCEGYRSRASYKLKQLNKKFKIIKFGDSVLDIGCAPGGWMQVSLEIVGEKGFVLGVDLQKIEDFEGENWKFLQGDINLEETQRKIFSYDFDVVISDISPKITGAWSVDSYNSVMLSRMAFDVAKNVLKKNGNFLCKVFEGEDTRDFFLEVKKHFRYTKKSKPKATRKASAEVYIIGKGFI